MKFAFFILAFFLLLQTYHARHLHDVFVNRRFYQPTPLRAAEIIQMVTRGEELLSPPLLQDKTTYGRVNSPPPTPQRPAPRGQTNYSRVNPKAPPSPAVAPPRGQATYGVENPTLTTQNTQMNSNPSNLDLHGIYGRDDPRTPPAPQRATPRGQTTYGRVNPKAPPSPSVAPSRGQTTFGIENPTFTAQTTQTNSNPSHLDLHGIIYGRDNPSAPTPPKPADPIRPMLSELYACIDSRSESTNLSTSVVNLLASYAFRVVNLWG